MAEHVAEGCTWGARAERRLHVGDDRQRLVVDADELGGMVRLLERLRGDDRDRLALVPDDVRSEHRLVGVLEPEVGSPGTSSAVSTACTPGAASACVRRSSGSARTDAGSHRDAPQHPVGLRSLPYANAPVTFGIPSTRRALSPTARSDRGVRSPAGRDPHRVDDLLVAGATAEVAG